MLEFQSARLAAPAVALGDPHAFVVELAAVRLAIGMGSPSRRSAIRASPLPFPPDPTFQQAISFAGHR
jgi:hypothetical protein